jgi:hypothetical protein
MMEAVCASQRRPSAHASGPYLAFAASPTFPAFVDLDAARGG